MSTYFDYDKAMERINILLEELQDPQIKMSQLEEKVLKARELIQACETKLKEMEEKLDENDASK